MSTYFSFAHHRHIESLRGANAYGVSASAPLGTVQTNGGLTYRVQWTIDAGDPSSIPKVRRSVIERLRSIAGKSTDLFMLEAVVGELLSAETGHGHVALAVILEEDAKPPLVHIYTQATNSGAATHGELREAILSGSHLPMSVETTSQGAHYCLEVRRQKMARNS